MTNPSPNDIEARELRGWIQPCEEVDRDTAQRELEGLGVDVGPWDSVAEEFTHCIVSSEAFVLLDPLWGRYVWGLM